MMEFGETGQVELFTAYSKAQASMGAVVKAANNPAFRSKYADLATVIEAVLPPMNAAGLAVIQSPSFDGEVVTVETFIAHTGGGWLRSALSMRPTKADPQGVGSATTYARRYALLSLAGVAPEDDDGNAASASGNGGQRFSPAANDAVPITAEQANELQELLESAGADRAKFLSYFKAASLATIPSSRFDDAVIMLQKKAAR